PRLPLAIFFSPHRDLRYLHSFPTRRSSDLNGFPLDPYLRAQSATRYAGIHVMGMQPFTVQSDGSFVGTNSSSLVAPGASITYKLDRKSTRLNSSHVKISYAVFCLKKKKKPE